MKLSFLQSTGLEPIKDFLKMQGLKDDKDNTRAKILSYWESIDIPSCPGSGKTTILTAKLAWAIEKWSMDASGICVLSHTNVAKEEIRKRLTSNQVNKLLGYPHFVGTIHEFFNKFLAIPWLKTNNIPIRNIDNETAYKKCNESVWVLGRKNKFEEKFITSFLRKNHLKNESLTKLNWKTTDTGEMILQDPDEQFGEFQRLIKKGTTKQGYHTHDDMLSFSKKLIFQYESISSFLCARFPIVLIDEAQDTNEAQAKLINKLFDPGHTIVQRFGDDDQQIYDFGEKNITDPFPNPARSISELRLYETQRCSPFISAVASKFSLSGQKIVSEVENGIAQPLPYIIVFDKKTAGEVIPKFAELVNNEIEPRKNSLIKVVGQIGKDNPDDKNFPYSICHYESSYVKPSDKRVGRPKNLFELIINCRTSFQENKENFRPINLFFSGIARLLGGYIEAGFSSSCPYRNVREYLDKIENNSNGLQGKELLKGLLNIYNDIIINEIDYDKIKVNLEELLSHTGFTKFSALFFETPNNYATKKGNRHFVGDLPIELNTIAGIKGETHLATLVLETFYRCHNIENAIQVVFNIVKPNSDTIKRIKHLYVSMTRPTNLLCLALPKDEFEKLYANPEIKNWFDNSFRVKDIS